MVRELIVALLRPDPAKRLGSTSGADELRESSALLAVDWEQLAEGAVASPLASRAAAFIRDAAGAAGSDASDRSEVAQPFFTTPSPSAAKWCETDF